ncbi:MAG: hypothetical protein ACK45Y_11710 [Betaproteobacteria bacterium]
MNLKSVMCCVFAFGLSITGGAFATDLSTSNQLDEKTLMSPSAYALLVAPIKSKSVLDTHLVEDADSPLSRLSTSAQTEFSASIRFDEKGITGFRDDALATHSRGLLQQTHTRYSPFSGRSAPPD